MSLWLEALKAAAQGHSDQARNLLDEIIIALRYPRLGRSDDDCAYDGPVAKAVLNAVNGFVDQEDRHLAKNNSEELIDYIVDLMGRKVERTIGLVEFCLAFPERGLQQVATDFDGLRPLKRTPEQTKDFVALRLRSMVSAGVEFEVEGRALREARDCEIEDGELLGFDEQALLKSLRINEKWIDFRQRERLTFNHESFDLEHHDIAAETSDFGGITSRFAGYEPERGLEFVALTEDLAKSLNETLAGLHDKRIELGYKPIAMHRVWWKYDRDQYLGLEVTNPECGTDEKLAEYIPGTYPEVRNINRQSARRRREKLEGLCREACVKVYQLHGQQT
ncbi:MAG: hypothetical protein AB7F88_04230 [Pyrinomonadaceae bacterium]